MPIINHNLSHPKYRSDIDGLRSIAVLSVVIFHAEPKYFQGGFTGVDIFFVISGFLISTIIFSNLANDTFSLREFYIRRIKRIFPALLIVLFFTYAIGWWVLLADEFSQLGKHIAAGTLFVSNLTLWSEAGYFDVAAEFKPLLHLWSLGIEEQFYIFWPLLLMLAWKKNYNIFTLTLLFCVISLILNLEGINKNPTSTFYFPQTRFWELLSGSLLAYFTLYPNPKLTAFKNHLERGVHRTLYRGIYPDNSKVLVNLLSLVGAAFLIFGFLKIKAELGFPGKWAIIPVLGAVLIISAGPQAWLNRIILSNRLAVWFGLISFPLYLWHWPLLSFARIMEEGQPRLDIRLGAVAMAIALAWLTYRLVEQPLRFGPNNRLKILTLCTLMAGIGVLGYYTFSQNGLGFRMQSRINLELLDQVREPLNTRISDGSCEKLLHFTLGTGAVCLTNSSAPEVLIVGDSHAMSLNSAAFVGRIQIKSLLMGIHGCLPLVGYSVRDGNIDKGCNALADEVLKVLARYPSIRTVVLATRGPFYFSGSGYGIEGASNYTIFSLDGNNTSQTEMFRNGYSRFIEKLILQKKDVVFVIDPPELGEDPKGCLFKRPVSILDKEISTCIQEKNKVTSRQMVYRELTSQIHSDNPGLRIYDPLQIFCDDSRCYGLRDKKLLYWDDDHITIWASELVLGDMRRLSLLTKP